MSEKLRNNLLSYGITTGVCLALSASYFFARYTEQISRADLYRILSDAFSLPGLLCGFAGALAWLSKAGALDGVSYVAQYAVKSLLFFAHRGALETYKEYVERRQAKKTGGYGFLFIVGAVFLAVGTVFTVLFMQTPR